MRGSVGKIRNYFLTTYPVHIINIFITLNSQLSILNFFKYYFPHHYSMFTKHFSQLACINARDTRNFLTFQPVAETFNSIPMTVFVRIVTYDNRFRVDLLTFHESGKSIRLDSKRRNTVVTYQRIGKRHQLSGV